MRHYLPWLLLVLGGCVDYGYKATSGSNTVETHLRGLFHGISHQQNGDGSSFDADNQVEGQALLAALVGVGVPVANALRDVANVKSANALAGQKAQLDYQLNLQKELDVAKAAGDQTAIQRLTLLLGSGIKPK